MPCVYVVLFFLTACSTPSVPVDARGSSSVISIKIYDDVRSKTIADADFTSAPDLAWTLTFDTATKWPSAQKLPPGFDPQKIIAWGKNPGLGVKGLHADGVTGKGVSVAVIDQELDPAGHEEFEALNVTPLPSRSGAAAGQSSYHGPGVVSILAGRTIGVAPGVSLFYQTFEWDKAKGQAVFADAVRDVIQYNQQLPNDRKIRALSISVGPGERDPGAAEFRAALKEAQESGILVVTVASPFSLMPMSSTPFSDKDDPASWKKAGWAQGYSANGRLLVPTSGVTTATGVPNEYAAYAYDANGGLSWAVPYVVGTLALGWQVDPGLSNEDAVRLLMESGLDFQGGKMISPTRFVEKVQQNSRP